MPLLLLLWTGAAPTGCSDHGAASAGDSGTGGGGLDSDGDGLDDDLERQLGTDPQRADTDGDGLTDREEVVLDSDPTAPDAEDAGCVSVAREGSSVRKPVDIILIIDNSHSMVDEIAAVVDHVSQNFADILRAGGLDFRIILLSVHGDPDADPDDDREPGVVNRVCVREPLSGTSCDPVPAAPANTDRFFHYHVGITSSNSLERARDTYSAPEPNGRAPGGWSDWLRPDAARVFLEITDDGSNLSADAFESWLFSRQPAHFGSAESPNYVFHSIIGIEDKDPASDAWLPDDLLQDGKCSTATQPGPQYQRLSMRTGGLRFPVCNTASYDVMFRAIAQGVLESTVASCTLEIPAPTKGKELNPARTVVLYRPSTGSATQSYEQVVDPSACRAGAFFVASRRVELCPATCEAFSRDARAILEGHVPCSSGLF